MYILFFCHTVVFVFALRRSQSLVAARRLSVQRHDPVSVFRGVRLGGPRRHRRPKRGRATVAGRHGARIVRAGRGAELRNGKRHVRGARSHRGRGEDHYGGDYAQLEGSGHTRGQDRRRLRRPGRQSQIVELRETPRTSGYFRGRTRLGQPEIHRPHTFRGDSERRRRWSFQKFVCVQHAREKVRFDNRQ